MRINKYMAEIGKKGGMAGTGKSKIRGDSDYYKKISKIAAEKRKEKKYYICQDQYCIYKSCEHKKPHLYDPKICNGEEGCCPPCVPYKGEV
jgi:hypothetical protein